MLDTSLTRRHLDERRLRLGAPVHEAAGYPRLPAGADDRVEPVGGGVRDRDEHLVGPCAARAGRAISSVPPSTVTPWIRRRRSATLSSRNPTTRASCPSRSSRARLRPARPAPTTSTRRRSARRWNASQLRRQPQQEPRGGHRGGADDGVDGEDPCREVAERARGGDDADGGELGDDAGGDDRERVARRRVAPDAPVDAEADEGHVAHPQHDRQRREEEAALRARVPLPPTTSR